MTPAFGDWLDELEPSAPQSYGFTGVDWPPPRQEPDEEPSHPEARREEE